MIFRVPNLMYTKVKKIIRMIAKDSKLIVTSFQSRSNTLLQCLLDLLLLSVQARNPQHKLNPLISEAIKNTIYLYIRGLFKLGNVF